MNSVEISGRLTRDPEISYVGPDGTFPICTLNMAVDDAHGRWNRETRVTEYRSGFYRVSVHGDYGASIFEVLEKGDEVYVKGSLAQFSVGEGDRKDTKTQIRAEVVIPKKGMAATVPDRPRQQTMDQPGWGAIDEEPF